MFWLLWGLDKDCCFRVLISLERDSLRELELGNLGVFLVAGDCWVF